MKLATSLFIGGMLAFAWPALGQSEEPAARGVIQALTEATIAMDYTARIAKLPLLEGQSFKKGQTLIVFDCRKYNAEVAAARAQAKASELVAVNNRKLLAKGAMGANEVKVSEAELEKARADIMALQARTGSCDFKAPFNGRLVERIAQEHETPSANQPLIKIVDMTRLELEVIIPSKWMNWVKPDSSFSFTVDETGETLEAQVMRLGATIDPVSQTIKAYGVLKTNSDSVLPGMSGTATFRPTGS